MGVMLFQRSQHDISLTEAGKAYLPYAMDILATSKAGRFVAKRTQDGEDKHISIALVSTSSAILMECLSLFQAKCPDVVVDISYNSGSEQQVALTESRFDFYFCHESMMPVNDQFEYVISHRDTLVLVVPTGHRLAGKPLDFNELKEERFITVSESSGSLLYNQISEICLSNDYHPKIVNRYDKAETVLMSVSAGLGVAILPKVLPTIFWPERVETIPIPNANTERPYIIAWPKKIDNPSALEFLKIVQEKFVKK